MRWFRLEIVGLVALGLSVFVPLILFVNSALIFIAGMISVFFIIWYMPFWRRRVRRALADAPKWELHPE